MVRQLARAPWWVWSVLSVVVIALVLLAVMGSSLWPRAEAQVPNPDPDSGLVVYLSASNYTVGEGDGQVVLTVVLSAASSQTVTVDYATRDGSAVAVSCLRDYEHTEGTLVFAPGETAKTLVINIIDNNYCEPTESFTLELSNAQGASVGSPSVCTITILDDEACP